MTADITFHPVQREKIKQNVQILRAAYFLIQNNADNKDYYNDKLINTISLVSFLKTVAAQLDLEAAERGDTIELKSKGLKFDNHTDLFCHYLKNGKIKQI